jgi:hypothetical protein
VGRVAEEIGRLEREVAQLRGFVAGEVDGLRAKIDRSRLIHASRRGAEGTAALDAPPSVPEQGALPAPVVEAESEEPPEVEEETTAEPDETATEADEGPSQVASEETPPEPPVVQTYDIHETRSKLTQMSDLELAGLYENAVAKAGGPFENEQEAGYWPAVVLVTVEEAAGRPEFGRSASDDSPSRREKKRRAKALGPLATAREESLAQADAPPTPEAAQAAPEEDASGEVSEEPPPATEAAEEASGDEEADEDEDDGKGKGKGRRGFLGMGSRRQRPFIDVAGNCGVCGRSFQAASEEALAESGWRVNGQVGLCPEDQELGWELPEGRPVPYKRGSD